MSTSMAPSEPQIGLIIRERDPVNLEYPFDQLEDFLTPNDLFYIRSHYKAPVLDRHDYKLTIGGAVDRPFTISYEELLAMPSVTKPATLECAGNGRIFLVPQVKGAQWQLGAVSTAEWTGVSLEALLERAGIHPEACEVLFEAADSRNTKGGADPSGEHAIRPQCCDRQIEGCRHCLRYERGGDPDRPRLPAACDRAWALRHGFRKVAHAHPRAYGTLQGLLADLRLWLLVLRREQ